MISVHPAPLRVASVPASHVYVRHLSAPDGHHDVIRLPDPVPADGRTVPGGWWPPLMLDPGWIRRNHKEFDVFHVHFGFDALAPELLADIVGELRAHGKPLLYTVHDLRNPHHRDPAAHRAQLDILVPAADEVITLTAGAARLIAERWGRTAHVLPHPHVVRPNLIRAPRPARADVVIGIHVKSLRANMDPLPIIDTLARLVPELPATTLRVDVHDELLDPENHWYNPDMVAALCARARLPGVRLLIHPYFDDDELWRYLSALTVSVLPYRFGTHSGWLEACHDLGTAVLAPSCGFYHQQRPCGVFGCDENGLDSDSLTEAVLNLPAEQHIPRATWPARRAERIGLAAAHRRLYERALDR
ncbi:glycosyltransferase family protein [Nocardia aurantia]|uniref:Glycosyltransferase subfamily 4-like N-terminal domain-containing protein n=1 Tax=Nocardia aurantia TaxID=2585199 RepID=A0A7K0DPU5_9NOCA|nr:glycosyltransferase family 1 protein [Nocardia aurantia]MQY27786.1 hypothetical protein [Nocardia aurantia]